VAWAALLSAWSGVLRLWQSSQSWSNSGTYSPRHRATAVERAIDRLRSDLVRQRVICDSNLSSSPKDEQQGLLHAQIGERGP
jgi:hypothetical protein